MAAFIAHPSVRIKANDHTYNPVVCQEETCAGKDKGPHMHCPLCTVTEAYQDPIILRAHFSIKHVEKGIDFSGLKVLRCCNHCEIVGTIKGEKRYKGAHWHCYRCRNGFNRKDEALKHYKTHFRNPHTTFQIQVTKDVNCRQYYNQSAEAHTKAYGGLTVFADEGAIAAIPEVTYTDSISTNGALVTSEEDFNTSEHQFERTQTLLLMDPDGQSGSLIYEEAERIVTEQGGVEMEQALQIKKQVVELQQQNEALLLEKHIMEKTFTAEIEKLQEQVKTLEEQHRTLLQTQLATLSMQLLPHVGAEVLKGHMEAAELSVNLDDKEMDEVNIIEVQSYPSALEDVNGETEEELVVSESIVKPNTAPSREVKIQDLSRKHSLQQEQMEGQIKLQRIC